ncbi:MAG: response regulator [Oscillospiraceae bacterium]|jgi:two-component system response regulator YesN|nr:response regulator [Oscillospiraceae bacterium]
MNLYKIILVDDEEEARNAIAKKLDWESLGFELVGEAANGEEALLLAEQFHPDVVMTDIKMPFMNGLTLGRRLRQAHPGIKLLIFSGFDDFEYAKEAIKLDALEYILKPVNSDELNEIFRRLRLSLDSEISEKRDVQRLRHYYEQSLPLMRQQFLTALLERRLDESSLYELSHEYGLDLNAASYCVAVMRINDRETRHFSENGQEDYRRLLKLSFQQIVQESLRAEAHWEMVALPDSIALLFFLEEGQAAGDVVSWLAPLFSLSEKLLGMSLSIGVGKIYSSLPSIYFSYKEAVSAIEYRILLEDGQCVYIGDVEPGAAPEQNLSPQCLDSMVHEVKVGDKASLRGAVDRFLTYFREAHPGVQQYQIFMLEVSAEILRTVRAYGLEEASQTLVNEVLGRSLSHFENIDEMGVWLFSICESLQALIRRERKDSGRILIERVKSYVSENYSQSDLSVESVAGEYGLSPSYFSTLFKKETGMGFVNYLTQLRMEKALEYMNTSDMKNYIIAEKVGYPDPNYFSYVFKRHYGVSPTKYRNDKRLPARA